MVSCFVLVSFFIFPCINSVALVDYVNPFLGSGGDGFGNGSSNPGAQLPLSSTRVGPDTTAGPVWWPWEHCGGYHYTDGYINAISHTHMEGSGLPSLGMVAVMPVSRLDGAVTRLDYGYRSSFSHSNETAKPGYYQVFLETPAVNVELTTSVHFTAIHRYTWTSGSGSSSFLLFPANHCLPPGSCEVASVQISPTTGIPISGSVTMGSGMASGTSAHWVARFNAPILEFGTWSSGSLFPGGVNASGSDVGAYVRFPTRMVVEMQLAWSWISVTQAQLNLAALPANATFDSSRAAASQIWERHLGLILATGGTQSQLVQFYSSLYRSVTGIFFFFFISDLISNFFVFSTLYHFRGPRRIFWICRTSSP